MSNYQVTLRALLKRDKSLIYEWKKDSDLRKMLGTIYPISEIEHENWFEKKAVDSKLKTFVIELSNGEAIGLTGYNSLDLINRNAEIFIFIAKGDHQGKGFGTVAMEEIINFSFNHLNLHMIYLNVFSYNKRAIKLYEKLGFKVDGCLRESKYLNGVYYDNIIMSLLGNEE